MTRLWRIALPVAGAALIAVSLAACTPRSATRGSIPTEQQIEMVVPGVHGRDDVHSILGTPSVVSTFDENTWYYIGRRTTQYAFFRRKTAEQQVLIVRFGRDGRLDKISRLDENDGREVALVERETPSAGRKLGILQQLFSNLGRFSDGQSEQ